MAPTKYGVLIVDVSGSMSATANVGSESTGRTVLEVTTQAASAFVAGLNAEHAVALVAFSGNARLVRGLTPMDPDGIAAMQASLESLQAAGSTDTCA